MKINAQNAAQFTAHCRNLAKLANFDYPETFYKGLEIYEKLSKAENQLNRLTTDECNTGKDHTKKTDKILETVKNIFTDEVSKHIFLNGDPRGYSLKFTEQYTKDLREDQEVNIYQDFGGYGILAPEF